MHRSGISRARHDLRREKETDVTNVFPVDAAMVRALAAMADLPLSEGRESSIASILSTWVRDANELSRKMSAARHRTVTPATVFAHPLPAERKV
jgi:hypothetical protein